jgi:3D (Asp-Asp-Asp) domain-containing protein
MKKTNEKLFKVFSLKRKKEGKKVKKHKWLKRFIAIEYIFVLNAMLIVNCAYQINYAVTTYQNSIEELKQQKVSLMNLRYNQAKDKIVKKEVNYTALEEKHVINDSNALQVQNTVDDSKVYLGRFKITHYCACTKCCGQNAKGITASGKHVEEGKTIAVDTKVIKMGSKVLIDGYGEYEAQDTGSAIKGNIIDVYVADHNQALQMGVQYKDVYLMK